MQRLARRTPFREKIKSHSLLLLCLSMIILLLVFSRSPAESVRNSLFLCYRTVIPSVFPFMVISSFMIRTGTHKTLASLLGKPIRLFFGCSQNATPAVLLGYLCGFPIGAASAAALYDNGQISKKEFERLLIFVNNPGAAFVIVGVGIGIFNSSTVGRTLYLSLLASSFIAASISRILFKTDVCPPKIDKSTDEHISVASAFTSALGDSAINTLTVCACVSFFSIPVGLLCEILSKTSIPPIFYSLIASFFEISGGCSSSLALTPRFAIMICAFACAWSGLSVHLQVFTVCKGRDLSFAPYLISKLSQGILAPILVNIFLNGSSELSFADGKNSIFISPPIKILSLSLFTLSLFIYLIKRNRRLPTDI